MTTTKIDDRRRPERVSSRIREELATALRRDLSDPRLANVVISAVDVTDDLGIARVALVVMVDDADGKKAGLACKVLAKLEGGLRKRLAPRLGMRRVPLLKFHVDHGREETSRLDSLMHEVELELGGKRGNNE